MFIFEIFILKEIQLINCQAYGSVISFHVFLFLERDKNQMRKFKNEIDILKCMEDEHINIFTLYGHCENESKYNFVNIVL
jgi:hypothetical protein